MFDDEQDMRCGQLAMTLLPTTRPSTSAGADISAGSIEHLLAQDNVRMRSKDGNLAQGDWAAQMISAIETRALWARYGL